MLAGAKEFESNAEMWINADPWSGGEAFLNDKECEALLAKYEKLAEKWNKRHQGGAKDTDVIVTVKTIDEEEEDSEI